MAIRLTLERIIRDEDDASGQSVREWKIERDGDGPLKLIGREGASFIMLRSEDIEQLNEDLMTIDGA